jgi:hypothetical protein
MPLFERKTVELTGVIGYLQVVASDNFDDRENSLYRHALEMRGELVVAANKQVLETLGPEFEVLNVEVRPGSAIIWIVIGSVGTVFMTFSRYESFVKSVNLLLSQLSNVMSRILGRQPRPGGGISVRSAWQPGPAITTANQLLNFSSSSDGCSYLIAYLVLSHAALMAVMIWLLVRHLK